nr:hypothetical protein [Streptomyces sp. NRRL F-2580]
MAFDDAEAPRQREAGGNGGEIAFETVDEGVKAGQVVGADRLDPYRSWAPWSWVSIFPNTRTWPVRASSSGQSARATFSFRSSLSGRASG